MITEKKEIYKCEFCRKIYQMKRAAEFHELICTKNPTNKRPCFGCDNIEKRDIVKYEDYYGGNEVKRTINVLYCKAKDVYLYPPKVEIKNNALDFGETNEPMPKDCDKYFDKQY